MVLPLSKIYLTDSTLMQESEVGGVAFQSNNAETIHTYRYVKKSRRIGCVSPRCMLLREITQPIIRLYDISVQG